MGKKKFVKIATDMYDDTKFKIIDTMAERDTINYIWTRLLTLCGKVNDVEGKLYVTKGMPYTIEILAVEFNRNCEQIESAITVFIDLNMISKDSKGVFKINNWCKYQDISRKNKKNQEKEKIPNLNKDNIEDEKKQCNDAPDDKHDENIEAKKPNNMKEIKSINSHSLNNIKTNIIDISNTDLVKDNKRTEKNEIELNIENKKAKVKRKKKKTIRNNNDIIITDEDEMDNEIIEFTEPLPMPSDCKSIAVFDFT